MNEWQLQEAKAHFSEVIKTAINHGPQTVTLRGRPVAVLISLQEYQQLTQPKQNLVEFLQQSPLKNIELDLTRLTSTTRDIVL